jgi:cyclophilin family peptidyl-prolyl cis-trans isomerase/HEAT repeat protein
LNAMNCRLLPFLIGSFVLSCTGGPRAVPDRDFDAALATEMRLAEDERAETPDAIAPLMRGVESDNPAFQAQAIRAFGRFERASLIPVILPHLDSPFAPVRIEAAQALAQTAHGMRALTTAEADARLREISAALQQRLQMEDNAAVRATLARSVGRIPYRNAAEVGAAERALAPMLAAVADSTVLLGALHGMEALVRLRVRIAPPSPQTVAALRRVASSADAPPRARRMALLTLNWAAAADRELLLQLARANDEQLRRLAVLAAAGMESMEGREELFRRLMRDDPSALVRIEAIRGWTRRHQSASCAPLLGAISDRQPNVSLAAIDALGRECPEAEKGSARDSLVARVAALPDASLASNNPAAREAAHRAARAVVSLARIAPAVATPHINAHATHGLWQVRMYAARAAAALGDTNRLVAFAADDHQNVVHAAITGLVQLRGHAADSIYLRALRSPDLQVVMYAARALEGTPVGPAAVPQLLASLGRITASRQETSRDARTAIINRIRDLATPAQLDSLVPYTRDFDRAIADSAAAILTRRTGRVHVAAPQPLPRVDAPLDDPADWRTARLRITMAPDAGGGEIIVELFPDEAPATVARITRLVREGYYNGLTIHRVVPNFVIQGGSPGANEYVGDGPYMRDEFSLITHERGTLGISTRGRDLGDAQFFVNLIDSPRLDFDYTVFGRVVSGMDVVDAILEGDVMAKVELIGGR